MIPRNQLTGERMFDLGSTYNDNTGRWTISIIETYWSCPEHDRDVNYLEECQECGRDPEVECLSCLGADWKILYDEDGWATMSVTSRFLDAGLESARRVASQTV